MPWRRLSTTLIHICNRISILLLIQSSFLYRILGIKLLAQLCHTFLIDVIAFCFDHLRGDLGLIKRLQELRGVDLEQESIRRDTSGAHGVLTFHHDVVEGKKVALADVSVPNLRYWLTDSGALLLFDTKAPLPSGTLNIKIRLHLLFTDVKLRITILILRPISDCPQYFELAIQHNV